MKFYLFCEAVKHTASLPYSQRCEPEVVIQVHPPGSIGGTPSVPLRDLSVGFDMDAGRVILHPETPLTALTPEQVADITESVRKGQSWHAYQQYKAYRTELAELTRQRDELVQVLEQIRDTIVVNEIRILLASIEAGAKDAINRVKGGAA